MKRHWCSVVDNVAINIVLYHELVCVPPIVEDLAAQNVPSKAPNGLVALLCQPVMTHCLRVDVMNLETAVMGVRYCMAWWQCHHEHTVVVHQLFASLNVREHAHVSLFPVPFINVQNVCWHQVKGLCVKGELCFEIAHDETVVTKFENCSWALAEAVEASLARLVRGVIQDDFIGLCEFLAVDLSIYKADRKAFWICQCDDGTATWCR